MGSNTLTVPFVGRLEVTVHPNGVDESKIRDAIIDGMREYLSKDMAQKWMSNPLGAQKPTAVEVADLFETFPLYIGAAPNCREWREKHASWSHAWASPVEPEGDDESDQVEQEDDVKSVLRELEKLGVPSDYMHTGGGCMVAWIELQGGYFLSTSQPDGQEAGYYWGIQNHEGETMLQGSWPGSTAAEAARSVATLIKTFGTISA